MSDKTIKSVLEHYFMPNTLESDINFALSDISQILEEAVTHEHDHWCFLHCAYKETEGVQVREDIQRRLEERLGN